MEVLSAARQSGGEEARGRGVWGEAGSAREGEKPALYGRGFVGARTEGLERREGTESRRPFYFGMLPAEEELPSLPTAVGKVRDNAVLGQPFRTEPRHRARAAKEAKEVMIVPVTQPANNNNNSQESCNRNMPVAKASLPGKAAGLKGPVVEPPQEELSRAFEERLARARLGLRAAGPAENGPEQEGAPPPPPAPVLPAPPRPPPPAPQWERRVSSLPRGPITNPRDELMRAIREKAGRPTGQGVAA
jgi:hypothetical protein